MIPPYSPSLQDWQRQVSATVNPALGMVSDHDNFAVKYAALGQLMQEMRTKATSVRTRLGRFYDVYTDQTGINSGASQFYDWDSRKLIGTQRTYKATVIEGNLSTTAGWTIVTGTVTSIAVTDPNVPGGYVFELDSGATPGNTAQIRRYAGAIPASFGATILMSNVTTNGLGEELECQFQNANGHLLRVRKYWNGTTGVIQFFYNGAWNTAFTSGAWSPGVLTECWFECVFNSGSNYTVRFFAGTQELPGFTGNLPGGNAGENGYIGFIQYSTTTANRKSRLGIIEVGSSALPQNMRLVSTAQDVVTEPTTVSMALLFEDVCLQTVIGTDIKADISKDGGTTWYPVTFANYDEWSVGILTTNAPIYMLAATVTLPPSGTHSVCSRITSANGRYFTVDGIAWRVDA